MLYAFSIGTVAFAAWRLLALNTILQMIRQRYDPQHHFQGAYQDGRAFAAAGLTRNHAA